jgi:proline iminopeptidase
MMATASINETEIFYKTVGEGLPCLVTHGGLGFDHTYLHPWLDPLGDTLHLIYYDHRGNGRSGRPANDTMTHENLAADADALASHLGHDKVAVIGHSYGGFIALEMALRHPDRLSHLILLDTAPAMNYSEEIMANAVRMGATAEMLAALNENWSSNDEMRERFPVIWPLYFKNFDPQVASRVIEDTIISLAGRAREGEMENHNVIARLSEIQIPTLILVGREDFICPPSQAHIMHAGIPDSELVIFENSGHLPWVEEPDLFFNTVRDWIKRSGQV